MTQISAGPAEGKRLIVVLGMHRSGTSAITRGLVALGVNLGANLMDPSDDENPSGFWEDLDIYRLNVEMLASLGSDWHHVAPLTADIRDTLCARGFQLRAVDVLRQKFRDVPTFGFKDPRMSLLLPFWKDVFSRCDARVSYVLAVRNPISVAKSLARRNQFDSEKSAILWLSHCVAMLEGTADADSRVVVDYDVLMDSPEAEMRRIAASIALSGDSTAIAEYCGQFLDPNLRHTKQQVDDVTFSDLAGSSAALLYSALHQVSIGNLSIDSSEFANTLERARRELDGWRYPLRLIDSLCEFKLASQGQARARDSRVNELEARLADSQSTLEVEVRRREGAEALAKSLQDMIAAKDAQLDAESLKAQHYRTDVERLAGALSSSEQRVSDLMRQLESLSSATATAESRLAAALAELSHSRDEIGSLKESLANSERRAASLLEHSVALQTYTTEKGARIGMLEEDLEAARREIENSKRMVLESQENTATLRGESESLRIILKEREAQLKAALDQARLHSSQIQELSGNCGVLQERTDGLRSEISVLREKLELERAASRAELAIFARRNERLADVIVDRERRIAALEIELELGGKTIDRLERAAAAGAEESRSARVAEAELRSEVMKCRERIAAFEAECSLLRRLVSQRDEQLGEAAAIAVANAARLDSLDTIVCALREKLKRALEPFMSWPTRVDPPGQEALTLEGLLALDGDVFVRAAYRRVLLRLPDSEGARHYGARLRAGVAKIRILAELSKSEEGSGADPHVPGLKSAIRRQSLVHTPVLGGLFSWVLNVESDSPLQRRVRALQQNLAEAIVCFVAGLRSIDEDVTALCHVVLQANRGASDSRSGLSLS
jgi:hypothetical protein